MTRTELYSKITPCGTMSYPDMVYLLSNVEYTDPTFAYLLIQRLSQTGGLSNTDWILFAKSVVFTPGSPINAATVEGWFANKCSLTVVELKMFLEYVSFVDGSQPTYILSQTGDFIISE